MKKIYLIISLFLFLICSCSTDSLTDTNTSNQSTTVSLSALLPNGTNTRVTESANATTGLVTSWNSSDQLSVLLSNGNMVVMSKDGTANGFTATVSETDKSAFTSGNIIYGVNNNSSDQITTSLQSGKLNTVVDFTGQNGSLDNISKYDLMYGKGDVSKSITFNHKVCVMRFDLSSTLLSGNITSAAFSFVPSEASPSLFADKETYNFGATSDSKLVNTNYYALTNPLIAVVNNKASIYLVIPMRKAVSGMLNLTLTCTDGSLIKDLKLSKSITITNKDFNPSTVQAKTISSFLTNAPAVGEYVFSDGTWGTLANNPSKTAIGVFFSSRVSDAEKAAGFIHGYALALKDASAAGPIWGPKPGDAGLTKVTTLAGYYKDINAGYDGTFTKKYDKSNGSYPAWKAANNYNVDVSGFKNSGWYLPSIGQWWDVVANLGKVDLTSKQTGDSNSGFLYQGNATATTKVNNAITAAPGGTGTALNFGDYWSASEYGSDNAVVFQIYDSQVYLYNSSKDNTKCCVRAVLAF